MQNPDFFKNVIKTTPRWMKVYVPREANRAGSLEGSLWRTECMTPGTFVKDKRNGRRGMIRVVNQLAVHIEWSSSPPTPAQASTN